MVVVDRLSKYAHFAPLPTKFNAIRVAQLFVNTVFATMDFQKLWCQTETVFFNATWEEMMRLSGTKLKFSTAYHSQSDRKTEVCNRGLEQYLRAFTADKPSKWAIFLPWAELALNCFHHFGLGTSLYCALYGRDPPSLVADPPSAKTPPNVAEMIQQRGELLVTLRRNLLAAQQHMTGANRHRRHVEFEVGDVVWLKLQPYRQHSLAKPLSAKLSRRYYGPFEVIKRVGHVAYKLRLPEGSRIHNVFHVSLLREFVAGTGDVDGIPLLAEFVGDRPVVKSTAILDEREIWRDGQPEKQALVRWSYGPDTLTWEPAVAITDHFPHFRLKAKAILNGGGVDTSTPVTPTRKEEACDEEVAQPENTPEPEEEQHDRGTGVAASTRSLRPRNKLKPSSKLKN